MQKFLFILFISSVLSGCSQNNSSESEGNKVSSELLAQINEETSMKDMPIETAQDQISYFIGIKSFEILQKASFYNDLNHVELCKGYVSSFSMDTTENAAISEKIIQMIGQNGKDFNAKYKDSGSYYLGKYHRIALESENTEYGIADQVSNALIVQGFRDAMVDNIQLSEGLLSDTRKQYYELASTSYFKKLNEQGIQFLDENKKNPKIKVTDSGLQYEILKNGSGPKPKESSQVKVHYHGTTPEGVVFDSSVDRGEPATFGLNQVIKGWTEGLQLMSVGSKFKFYIPQELAYGANPQPGSAIKPYMPLVFEVELLSILN